MKFYVASNFHNYVEARAMMQLLRMDGHEITFDWTSSWEFDSDGVLRVIPEKDLTPEQKEYFAVQDMLGVYDADILVLLYTEGMAGAWIEVGLALSQNKRICIINSKRFTIFYGLSNILLFDGIPSFFNWLHNV